jgi:hypothetical protein
MKANSPMGKKYCAELLTKLVDIPSTFPNEEEVMLFLERELTTLGMRPERIVYVSCNPASLARDLAVLADAGYLAREIQPVDMFPQTFHIESVVLLQRKPR